VYFSDIHTVFDLDQIAGLDLGLDCITLLLISSHPSGQKGSYGHSIFCFRVSVFLFRQGFPAGAAVDGGLIFINIGDCARRYGEIMARRGGSRPSGAGQENEGEL
jgi:hypothetical protein